MSDLASSNDVATNGVNCRIGCKTWCKSECCAPMETSIKGVCCLEITEICNPRFSSTSCLNVCRLDPHFELWYSRREYVVSYLISTHCWSLANQNKSFVALQTSWLSFSVKHLTLLMRSFSLFSLWEMFFVSVFFSREHPIGFRVSVIIEKQYLIVRIARSSQFTGAQEPFKWKRTLQDTFFFNLKKYIGLVSSIFLSTSEGLLLNIPETRPSLLWIFHFSLL